MKRDDHGTITVFVTVFMTALVLVAGLVIDGGNMIAARREAFDVAESAARAGAQAIDENATRASGAVHLDPIAAQRQAEAFLTVTGFAGSVTVVGDAVIVDVTITKPLFILGVGGLATATVTGRGEAHAVRGVTAAGN